MILWPSSTAEKKKTSGFGKFWWWCYMCLRRVSTVHHNVVWRVSFVGEEKLSYGYDGTGKASTNCEFKEYGQTFGLGDVITAYVVRFVCELSGHSSNTISIQISCLQTWCSLTFRRHWVGLGNTFQCKLNVRSIVLPHLSRAWSLSGFKNIALYMLFKKLSKWRYCDIITVRDAWLSRWCELPGSELNWADASCVGAGLHERPGRDVVHEERWGPRLVPRGAGRWAGRGRPLPRRLHEELWSRLQLRPTGSCSANCELTRWTHAVDAWMGRLKFWLKIIVVPGSLQMCVPDPECFRVCVRWFSGGCRCWQEEPWFAVAEGFTLINSVEQESRVRATLPPVEKTDCQVRSPQPTCKSLLPTTP